MISTIEVPDGQIERRAVVRPGATLERAIYTTEKRLEFRFAGASHLLAYCERGSRSAGETSLDGSHRSGRHQFGGTFVFVPAGVELQGWSIMQGRSIWMNLYFDPDDVCTRELGPLDRPLLHVEDLPLSGTAAKLQGLLSEEAKADSLYLDLLTQVLVVELHRFSGRLGAVPKGGLTRSAERRIREFIAANLDQDVQLDELAGIAGLSRYHFSRAFAGSFGLPPHRYVLQQRIDRASQLLTDTDDPVTEIALNVGFSTPSHFATCFREFTGMSPSAFRRSRRI